jgi:hypothetical protein
MCNLGHGTIENFIKSTTQLFFPIVVIVIVDVILCYQITFFFRFYPYYWVHVFFYNYTSQNFKQMITINSKKLHFLVKVLRLEIIT